MTARTYVESVRRSTLALLMATATLCCGAVAEEAMAPVPQLTLEELRAKYTRPDSRFMEVDGAQLHYMDEGEGPAVLLLHASYHSLRTWDLLADRLKSDYRVIRFDFPTAGLSVDKKPVPEEKFSMMGRYQKMVSGIAAALELDAFTLVGTSSGAAVAFRYAGANPDMVERLVLINSAGMPRIPRTDPLRDRGGAYAKWQGMQVRPREFWEFSMSQNFIAPHKPPAWMVDQAWDFSRREGRAQRAESYRYSTGDPKALLGKITSPTLIMWGKNNPTVMHLEADVIQHWMTGAPTMVRKYEGLGHYPYVEDLDAIYPDLSAFIAGDLDPQLRRTTMMKADADCECAQE